MKISFRAREEDQFSDEGPENVHGASEPSVHQCMVGGAAFLGFMGLLYALTHGASLAYPLAMAGLGAVLGLLGLRWLRPVAFLGSAALLLAVGVIVILDGPL